jgi:GPH family glycoside/pentoside/hexuronide:cation symporter
MLLSTFAATGASFLLMPFVGLWGGVSPFIQTGVVMTLIGMAVSGFMLLPFAIMSDVVDYDERLTGRRREAVFFGFQGTFQKVTLGVSSFIFGQLAYRGSGGEISVGGLRAVALLAGGASLLGFCVFLTYPLREREGKLVVKD